VKLVELVDNSGSVSNLNTIEIIAKAGYYELEVRIKNDKNYEYFYKSQRLKPGESKTFTVKVPDKYTIEAYHGDKLMESENSGKKSGLSGSGGL